jgi:AMP phosphorylase
MELTAEELDIAAHSPTVLFNAADAEELGIHPLDRVQIRSDDRTYVGIVEITEGLLPEGTVGVTQQLGHIAGRVDVTLSPKPASVSYITKKLRDVELERREIGAIVDDIDHDRLNDVELSAFVSGIYANGLSRAEVIALTEQMVDAGRMVTWDRDVVADKHSIGGVAGNRVTPIVVPIVAAAGLTIPKTSSRAVTSAAGTADTMEVFCDVTFSIGEIKQIVEATGGCMVWGGSVNLSPVDDKIIRAETPLSLDPPGQVIASVLSKKESAGSTHVVIDIPYGEGAKVESLPAARELAEDFARVGDHIGMEVECAITRGQEPIGRGIGPILEARDVLEVLAGEGPRDLRVKSLRLAETLLDICGADEPPTEILDSGRALDKFREIIEAQGGEYSVEPGDLKPGDETATIEADRPGVVAHVNNRLVNEIARRAGAPKDKGAGIDFHRHVSDRVDTGEPLFTIYAEKADKLDDALARQETDTAVRVRSPDEALVERF